MREALSARSTCGMPTCNTPAGGAFFLCYPMTSRGRGDGFAFDRDARRFIVSRAVLRTLLSRVTGVPARELKFQIEPDGKPILELGMGQPVHFSVSRSEELVLIGFAPRPLGVDIEWLERAIDVEALANYVLSRRERDSFKRLDPRNRRQAFFQCWTIKEAYLKAIVSARGGGCLRRAGSRPKPCRVNRRLRHPSSLGQRLGDDRHLCDSGANPGWHINDHIYAYQPHDYRRHGKACRNNGSSLV